MFKFPRASRLTRPKEFAETLKLRPVVRGSRFALHLRLNGLAVWRLGLVISKRYAAHAVERNIIKRSWREAFRLRQAQLHACQLADETYDVVVRLLPGPATPGKKGKRGATPKRSRVVLKRDCHDQALALLTQLRAKLAPSSGPDGISVIARSTKEKSAGGGVPTGYSSCVIY